MRRGTEWTPRAQSRALALGIWEARKCPNCGNYDALEPLNSDLRYVTWDDHRGRKAEVAQYRCIFCGSAELVRRDFTMRHKDHEPMSGHASPMDGRMFIARPIREE